MTQLSNPELLARLKHLVERERQTTASLIAHLAELDHRRLYLAEGYSSLFTYCTQVLHLSEHAAYGRIQAARMARRFPVILEMLEEGSVTLTTVVLLAAHLTPENHRELLGLARHQSRRVVEELVARLRPQPPIASSVRRLPRVRRTSGPPLAQHEAAVGPEPARNGQDVVPSALPPQPRARPAVVAPLAPQRYKVQFMASADTYKKLRLAQAFLRHQIPDGDPAKIFDLALTVLLQNLTKKKLAATNRPRESPAKTRGSRHIPAEVKRKVWLRDGGQCAFVGHHGRRCTERGFLEFHHIRPYAAGGESAAENIQLRCRAHNGYEAELDFGPRNPRCVREARASYLTPSCAPLPPSPLRTTATRSEPSSETAALHFGGSEVVTATAQLLTASDPYTTKC